MTEIRGVLLVASFIFALHRDGRAEDLIGAPPASVANVVTASAKDVDTARGLLQDAARNLDRSGVTASSFTPTNAAVAAQVDRLVKANVPLNAWVAVLGETPFGEPRPPLERALGLERVVKGADAARAPLAAAVLAAPSTQLPASELFLAMARLGDDDKQTFESVLAARVREFTKTSLLRGADYAGEPAGLAGSVLDALKAVGSHRAVPLLHAWYMKEEVKDTRGRMVDACHAMLDRSKDPDAGLAPILRSIDPLRVRDRTKLCRTLELARHATKDELTRPLSDIASALSREVLPRDDANQAQLLVTALQCATRGLAAIGSSRAVAAIFAVVDQLNSAEDLRRRTIAITSLSSLSRTAKGPDVEVLALVVRRLREAERDKPEFLAYVSVLESLTEKGYGSNVEGWASYVEELRHGTK